MRPSDVLSHFPHPNPIIQIEIHAKGISNKPHGRTHVDRPHPLLHARRLEIENESNIQDIQLPNYQSMHRLL